MKTTSIATTLRRLLVVAAVLAGFASTAQSQLVLNVDSIIKKALATMPAPKNMPHPDGQAFAIINAASADGALKPGDIMFKLLNDKASLSTKSITDGQKLIKLLDDKYNSAVHAGDPMAVHVIVYLGNGRTAEAHNGKGDDNGVIRRSINDHDSSLFYVMRPVNRVLAKRVVEIADTWATGRMKYRMPLKTASTSAFGPVAHADAYMYGKFASTAGGPKTDFDMFCSQFAIAVYQAAIVEEEMKHSKVFFPENIKMLFGVDVHAANTTPMTFHGRLLEANLNFEQQGRVFVQK